MKFRVLCGIHSEGGRTYEAGSVVDSKSDLSRLNYTGVERFQRSDAEETTPPVSAVLTAPVSPTTPADSLSNMTVEELRKFAEETEVDLGKARTREQILAVLRSAT